METVSGMKLFDYQIDFLCDCLNNDRIAAMWCRQIGKTTTIALFSLYYALTNPKTTTLIIAPTDRQASEMFNRLRAFAEDKLKKYIQSSTLREITFVNGSIVRALPTGDFGNTIRGQTAHAIILEESAYIKDEIVNQVIMPMIGAKDLITNLKKKVIQIGTPFGSNHFTDAISGERYKSHIYDYNYALNAELFTEEFIKEQKENLTDLEFNQEYGCIPMSEADAYFPPALVQSCIEEIMPEGEPYAQQFLGVDFARMGQDSCLFIRGRKDDDTLRIVEIIETRKKALTEAVGRIRMMDEKYHFAKIYLDETGMGAGPTDFLKEQGQLIEPITFTIKSKLDIYSNLKALMEKGKIKIPNDKKLMYQLLDFRYELTSTGQMKLHHSARGNDDYCDALALVALSNRIHRKLTRGKIVHR